MVFKLDNFVFTQKFNKVDEETLSARDFSVLWIRARYDAGYSVSEAQLSSKIFRKHFLKEPIFQIHPYVRKIAESTIHGGRANTFIDTPIVIPNVKMYDYNSFYPYAMTKLPALTKGEWYKAYDFENE